MCILRSKAIQARIGTGYFALGGNNLRFSLRW
jgi:hypothetical protein